MEHQISDTPILANDFSRQWQEVREDVLTAVERVGQSGWLILGAEVDAFQTQLASWWGFDHAVGVASGMDALEIALRCAGIEPGMRVLTTPLTAFATTLAILRCGAQPVWCDVDDSGLMNLDAADAALHADSSIRFLLPVHLYGHPLDPDRLERLVKEYELTLVEDCAQSAGARRSGRPTGTVGAAAAVSLYPTKNLGAMGDAGVILTDDEVLAAAARKLRDYGQTTRYVHDQVGLNSRLDELQAALLRSALLTRLDGWLARRSEIAAAYTAGLAPLAMELRAMTALGGTSANHLYPVEIVEADPEKVRVALSEVGIPVARHYPRLCSDQEAATGRGVVIGSLSTARRLAEREVSLPIHPYLDDSAVERVIQACHRAAGR